MNSNNQNNVQKSTKNKIIVGITAFAIIIIIAAVATTTIIMPKVSCDKFKDYALIDGSINDCYSQSKDEKSAVSEGLELYYEDHNNYKCSDNIIFNTEYETITHIVLTGNATSAAENGFISKKFSGVNYSVTIDVPEDVLESKKHGEITQDDVEFTFEILN